MSTFAIQFDKAQGVVSDLKACSSSLNGYKGTLGSAINALDGSMEIRNYAMIRRRLDTVLSNLGTVAVKTQGMGSSLDSILSTYRQAESTIASIPSGGIRIPYGTLPGGVQEAGEILNEIINRHMPGDESFMDDRTGLLKMLEKALKKMLEDMGKEGSSAGGGGGGRGRKQDILDRLSEMFAFPGDIVDGISDLYDLSDREGFDKSGIGGFITSVLGILGGGAAMAGSGTVSELYRNAVDFAKDGLGGLKDMLSMFKKADIIPDNNLVAGFLFGLKAAKNSMGFSVSFLENYENNRGNLAGFLRDSGEMADDLSGFIQGLYTSKDGFLKGLEGKELIALKTWGTAITSLYTAGSYSIGDIIDKAKKGTLDWGSGAESFGKGAVGGLGKIHKFLTLGLVEPDMDKTWNIYRKHVDKNVKLVNKYGKNWFSKTGLTIYATVDSLVEGTCESIWSSSYDAAEKIVTKAQTAYNVAKDSGTWIWNKGKELVSWIW